MSDHDDEDIISGSDGDVNGEGIDDADDDDDLYFGRNLRNFVYPDGELGAQQRAIDKKFVYIVDSGAYYGAEKMIEQFIVQGVPIDHALSPTGETLLFSAENGRDVKLMLAAGVPRDAQEINGNTLLHVDRDEDVMHALLQAGADPHGVRNKLGETPYQANSFVRKHFHDYDMNKLANKQVELLTEMTRLLTQVRDMMLSQQP